MRLLIADKLHSRAIEELRSLPIEVVYEPEVTAETLEKLIAHVGILVVRSTEVTAATIDAARQLHLIVRAGASFGTIDVRAASQRGIYVANCPGKNAAAVAELVMGLILALDRRIPDAVASMRSGRWERSEFSNAEGLYGKTIGILGLGAVGREVAQRARSFGLHVIAFSRGLSVARAADLGFGHATSVEDLASRSQIVTVHLALVERTRQIVHRGIIDLLPDRALFVNTARADLVDYDALRDAVRDRGLRAAVDVFPNEPKGRRDVSTEVFETSPTGGILYGTPHIASATDQAQRAIASETVRVIRSFLFQGDVPNVVNVSPASSARFQVVVRMIDKLGTFAHVLSVFKRHGIRVEEVTNTVFDGANASCAKLRVVSRPSEACLAEIRAFEEVIHVETVSLPSLA
ncbi:MAG: NAD(P)-dependent oxidoreductase [Myxococcales bacterium]